jgi:hypothetical protein
MIDNGTPTPTPLAAGRQHVNPGDTIASTWGNTVFDQSVNQFVSTGDRDSQWVGPPDGALCYTAAENTLWLRRTGIWTVLSGASRLIARSLLTANTSPVTTETNTGQTVTSDVKANRRYTVKWVGMLNSTVGADRAQIALYAGATVAGLGSGGVPIAGNAYTLSFEAPYVPGADATAVQFRATIARAAGTGNMNIVAGATYPSVLALYDDGLP